MISASFNDFVARELIQESTIGFLHNSVYDLNRVRLLKVGSGRDGEVRKLTPIGMWVLNLEAARWLPLLHCRTLSLLDVGIRERNIVILQELAGGVTIRVLQRNFALPKWHGLAIFGEQPFFG